MRELTLSTHHIQDTNRTKAYLPDIDALPLRLPSITLWSNLDALFQRQNTHLHSLVTFTKASSYHIFQALASIRYRFSIDLENPQGIEATMDLYVAMIAEIEHMRNMLFDNQRLMSNALAERDRACSERDQATKDLMKACTERDHANHDSSRLREQIQRLQDQFKDAQDRFTAEISQLQHKIDFLTDQVDAKRALWMDYHPHSTAKSSKARDPFLAAQSFETPTKGGLRYGTSSQRAFPPGFELQHQNSMELSPAPTLPTRGMSSMSSMPYGRAQPAQHVPYNKVHISTHDGSKEDDVSPYQSFTSHSASLAPSGSTSLSNSFPSTALVPFKSNEQATLDLIDEIDKFLGMIFGWVRIYAALVNPIESDQIVQDDKPLWAFMTGCVAPFTGKIASHRIIRLLRNGDDRPWLVMRMVVEYIRTRIWQWRAWNGFDDEITMELSDIAEKLDVKGKSAIVPLLV